MEIEHWQNCQRKCSFSEWTHQGTPIHLAVFQLCMPSFTRGLQKSLLCERGTARDGVPSLLQRPLITWFRHLQIGKPGLQLPGAGSRAALGQEGLSLPSPQKRWAVHPLNADVWRERPSQLSFPLVSCSRFCFLSRTDLLTLTTDPGLVLEADVLCVDALPSPGHSGNGISGGRR